MGSVRFGIPRDLVLALKAKYNAHDFFETGTLEGHTSAWAADHFFRVTTVDIVEHPNAPGNLDGKMNVKRHVAPSSKFLTTEHFYYPTLFWLDAHTDTDCPVLLEIKEINRSDADHVILVDDVRLFDKLPDWPKLEKVCVALRDGGRRVTEIIEDVIIATPCP